MRNAARAMLAAIRRTWTALPRAARRGMVITAVAGLALILLGRCLYRLDESELAWIPGGPDGGRAVISPGLRVKRPWQSIRRFSGRVETATAALALSAARDGRPLTGRADVAWRLSPQGLGIRAGLPDSDAELARRLAEWIGAEIDRELSRRTLLEIVSLIGKEGTRASGRIPPDTAPQPSAAPTEGLLDLYGWSLKARSRFGIELLEVSITRIELPETEAHRLHRTAAAAFRRLAERRREEAAVEAAGLRAGAATEAVGIRGRALAQAATLAADGRKKAAALLAQAEMRDPDLAALIRGLAGYRAMLDEDATLVVEVGREFYRRLQFEPHPSPPPAQTDFQPPVAA
ncbi:MAG: hypothetical protein HRF43_17635, partial [Phycisphaerae bacterium]